MKLRKSTENINKEKELEKIVKIDSLEEIDKINGGISATACAIIASLSIAFCPTSKCSSQCGKRNN